MVASRAYNHNNVFTSLFFPFFWGEIILYASFIMESITLLFHESLHSLDISPKGDFCKILSSYYQILCLRYMIISRKAYLPLLMDYVLHMKCSCSLLQLISCFTNIKIYCSVFVNSC